MNGLVFDILVDKRDQNGNPFRTSIMDFFQKKLDETKAQLPKPPYGKTWTREEVWPAKVGETERGDWVYSVTYVLVPDGWARRRFHRSNRRRWAAWSMR